MFFTMFLRTRQLRLQTLLLGILFIFALCPPFALTAHAAPTAPATSVAPAAALASPPAAQPAAAPSAPSVPSVPCPDGGCGGYPYWGANINWMVTATNLWPQGTDYWCGVANIQTIERYDWIKYNGNDPQQSQSSIANALNNSSAQSPWGAAQTTSNPPKFTADIAGDTGTDPRAITYGAWDLTPNGYYFHNYIYSGYQGSTNNSATYEVASDFGPAHGVNDPVSITIWGGRHSFIEDGVVASSDPSAGGETVTAVDLWDPAHGWNGKPGYLFNYKNALVSIYDWENFQYASDPHYYYWKYPYDAGDDTWLLLTIGYPNIPVDPGPYNQSDPDPFTKGGRSIYYNIRYYDGYATIDYHWAMGFVTIEQDYVSTCSYSPNYALDRYGNLFIHNGSTACG